MSPTKPGSKKVEPEQKEDFWSLRFEGEDLQKISEPQTRKFVEDFLKAQNKVPERASYPAFRNTIFVDKQLNPHLQHAADDSDALASSSAAAGAAPGQSERSASSELDKKDKKSKNISPSKGLTWGHDRRFASGRSAQTVDRIYNVDQHTISKSVQRSLRGTSVAVDQSDRFKLSATRMGTDVNVGPGSYSVTGANREAKASAVFSSNEKRDLNWSPSFIHPSRYGAAEFSLETAAGKLKEKEQAEEQEDEDDAAAKLPANTWVPFQVRPQVRKVPGTNKIRTTPSSIPPLPPQVAVSEAAKALASSSSSAPALTENPATCSFDKSPKISWIQKVQHDKVKTRSGRKHRTEFEKAHKFLAGARVSSDS